MKLRPRTDKGQEHRPSRKIVLLVLASALAFGVTLLVPVIGSPIIAAAGVATFLGRGD